MDEQEELQVIVTWARELPAGQTFTWYDNAMAIHPGAQRASWIDVHNDQASTRTGLGWLATIVTPEDEDAEYSWPEFPSTIIALEPDCLIWCTDDAENMFNPANSILTALDAVPQKKDMDILIEQAGPNGQVLCEKGWTYQTINKAIASWLKDISGKDLNVEFDPNGVSDYLVELIEQVEDIKHEREGTYLIGIGEDGTEIRASENFMNAMIELGPDDAADLERTIMKILPPRKPKGPGIAGP